MPLLSYMIYSALFMPPFREGGAVLVHKVRIFQAFSAPLKFTQTKILAYKRPVRILRFQKIALPVFFFILYRISAVLKDTKLILNDLGVPNHFSDQFGTIHNLQRYLILLQKTGGALFWKRGILTSLFCWKTVKMNPAVQDMWIPLNLFRTCTNQSYQCLLEFWLINHETYITYRI